MQIIVFLLRHNFHLSSAFAVFLMLFVDLAFTRTDVSLCQRWPLFLFVLHHSFYLTALVVLFLVLFDRLSASGSEGVHFLTGVVRAVWADGVASVLR